MNGRRGIRLPGVVLGAGLLVGACARSSSRPAAAPTTISTTTTSMLPPTTTGPQLSGGYLVRWTNGAIFVQLTMTGPTSFEGTAVFRVLFTDGPQGGENHLTGRVNHDDLVFRFDPHPGQVVEWPGAWSTWSGSLHADGTFTMQLPYPSGRLDPAEFEPGTADDYNAALKHARPLKPLP